jgi:hypothetical protein
MQKIPVLFKRAFHGHKLIGITPEVTEGCEWVLEGQGEASVKLDGAACAIIGGRFYKRYDAKNGKDVPEGAIVCDIVDKVTGHNPCWVEVRAVPSDKWFCEAYDYSYDNDFDLSDGTFEAVGPHFQGGKEPYLNDQLIRHGSLKLPECPRTFEGLIEFLLKEDIEGVVFAHKDGRLAKIRKKDFDIEW